jgi:hypothetical protein
MKRKKAALAKTENNSLNSGRYSGALKSSDSGHAASSSPFVSLRVRPVNSGDSDAVQSDIRVLLRSGHQLMVASGFDVAHLGRLVAVLESQS